MTVAKVYEPKAGDDFSKKYAFDWSGTSLAAPFATGVVGLMKSANPRLAPGQVINIIRRTGKNIDKLNPTLASQLGGGLIDAGEAVRMAKETAGELPINSAPQNNILLVKNQPPIKKQEIIITSASSRVAAAAVAEKEGKVKNQWPVFPEFFRGGANVASGDIDGDGEDELIVAAGAGGGPQVRIFTREGELVTQFFAYNRDYRNGVTLVAADINSDGADDLVLAAGDKNGSLVSVIFSNGDAQRSFKIKTPGASGPVNLAAADLNGDGQIELIAGAGVGALPEIQIFDTVGNKKGLWLAFPKSFRGGARVAAGDVDGDGQVEIVTAPASKGGPQVRIFTPAGRLKHQFFAFDKTLRMGLSVAVGNVDNDPLLEVIVGTGPGVRAAVSVFSKFGADFAQESTFNVFEDKFKGGVNVSI
jgi:hypothetical protein